MSDTRYMTSYLATTGNRKVHFEFAVGHLTGLPTCNSGGPVVTRIAELDGNLPELIATLKAHNIAPSRLCGHCFAVRTRAAYTAARQTGA